MGDTNQDPPSRARAWQPRQADFVISVYTSAAPNHLALPEGSDGFKATARAGQSSAHQTVVDNYDQIVRQLTATRSAGIFESTVTMAQLKVLMLLGAKPETRHVGTRRGPPPVTVDGVGPRREARRERTRHTSNG